MGSGFPSPAVTPLDAGRRPVSAIPLSQTVSEPRLRVLSLGAGVQSTTLALMAARGLVGPMPDCAVFADTGAEPAAVYRHLAWLEAPGTLPFPVRRVSAGDLRQEILDAARGIRGAWGRPPLFVRSRSGQVGMTRRQCTQDYKLDPIRREVRTLLGLKPRQRGPREPVVEQWIGISFDEALRMRPSGAAYVANRYPLVELGLSRRDCLAWLKAHGLPTPPKSSCTFCPYHSDAHWRSIRDDDPTSWADAVVVDRALRSDARHHGLRGELYLHRSCRPLDEVDLSTAEERGQLGLFVDECLGLCGV